MRLLNSFLTVSAISAKEGYNSNVKIHNSYNGNYYYMFGYKILENEEDLYNRIEKAVAHLNNFCFKKKEKF